MDKFYVVNSYNEIEEILEGFFTTKELGIITHGFSEKTGMSCFWCLQSDYYIGDYEDE